ncbi:MAG: succinylglutamate desuccinylase/aspartoacylase family protein [Saprospiraceae bacterium]|nr:succinylglutamate desuccinylase/aspartoacylase family protein [Saprospiraceae bacterium]
MAFERIIGRFTGERGGPLVVCMGGVHGNEKAGVEALELVFKMLEVEPITNPYFRFRGRLLGIKGNLQALNKNVRYLEKDLNRQWTTENAERILNSPPETLEAEDREIFEILTLLREEIEQYRPPKMVVLDLHTTSAFGGIFTIVNETKESLEIGVQLHAPVILGLTKGIQGTSLHYFTNENFPIPTVAVSFEAGQHEEPLSVNRSIAAVINCLRTVQCVRKEDVENRHDELLIDFSKNLPKVNELVTNYHVKGNEVFELVPGLRNFQPVKKDQLLGTDADGPILSPDDGLILMPRYQKQGDDGFFIIKESKVPVEN